MEIDTKFLEQERERLGADSVRAVLGGDGWVTVTAVVNGRVVPVQLPAN